MARSPQPRHELTGERTLPGILHENYWFRRHEAAYRWVSGVAPVRGGVVVDAGVGEGYGGQELASAGAAIVLGLDLDLTTLRHVAAGYPDVRPVCANLVRLPCRTGSVDVVVAAQVVEHLWDQGGFVREGARVLRPGGRLVVTTPNRATFPAGNPFHSRELDGRELVALVTPHLQVELVRGLHHGRRLASADAEHGDVVAAQLAGPPEGWSPVLLGLVASVTAEDFLVGAAEGALDLLAVAVRD
ncbi:MAG: methyltransferase domain-containing protein [Actinomycetes bacterium]